MKHDVGALDDYPEGLPKIVDVGGWEVGIVRWKGDAYALRNVCPHELAPVCRGLVRPRIVSPGAPGMIGLDDDMMILTCPWHGWEFDIQTGHCVSGDPHSVRTYPVSIDNGRVLVDVPERRRTRGGLVTPQPGPS
jgi:nitrite reductase (NADH) small subunit